MVAECKFTETLRVPRVDRVLERLRTYSSHDNNCVRMNGVEKSNLDVPRSRKVCWALLKIRKKIAGSFHWLVTAARDFRCSRIIVLIFQAIFESAWEYQCADIRLFYMRAMKIKRMNDLHSNHQQHPNWGELHHASLPEYYSIFWFRLQDEKWKSFGKTVKNRRRRE